MAISAKELPKNHTDKERFAASSSCIATEILTLLLARKRRRSTGPVLHQPPRSRSRRVPDLKVPTNTSMRDLSVAFYRTLRSWKSEWFYQKYSKVKYVPFVLRRLSKCARNPICASCLRKTLFERELWSLQTKPATKVVTYKNKC